MTIKPEDILKYLFDKEEAAGKGEKEDYGIYLDDEYIGNISLFDIDQKNSTAELGYWLSADFADKGYMIEAVRRLGKETLENLKLNRLQIICYEENRSAVRVAGKCGYHYEGKLREEYFSDFHRGFRNSLIFSRLSSEYRKQQ